MHDEERVVRQCLDALLRCDYPRHLLEIIPIDDHSTDGTGAILDDYAARHAEIRPLHRRDGQRGKPAALNDALAMARGDVIVVFDADYVPNRGALREIAICFKDPEVGAVMGRVVPYNTRRNLLTRLLDLERSGGYQVDQQARHNLRLMPQYGGTVGGFRRAQAAGPRRLRPARARRGHRPHAAPVPARLQGRLREPARVLRGGAGELGGAFAAGAPLGARPQPGDVPFLRAAAALAVPVARPRSSTARCCCSSTWCRWCCSWASRTRWRCSTWGRCRSSRARWSSSSSRPTAASATSRPSTRSAPRP